MGAEESVAKARLTQLERFERRALPRTCFYCGKIYTLNQVGGPGTTYCSDSCRGHAKHTAHRPVPKPAPRNSRYPPPHPALRTRVFAYLQRAGWEIYPVLTKDGKVREMEITIAKGGLQGRVLIGWNKFRARYCLLVAYTNKVNRLAFSRTCDGVSRREHYVRRHSVSARAKNGTSQNVLRKCYKCVKARELIKALAKDDHSTPRRGWTLVQPAPSFTTLAPLDSNSDGVDVLPKVLP